MRNLLQMNVDKYHTYEKDNFKIQLFFELSLQGYISIYPIEGIVWNNVTNRKMGYVSNSGYIQLAWKYQEKSIKVLAHRLIWWTYYGPIEDHLTINHIDGNKQNNKISNLEKVTYSENALHAFRTGLRTNEDLSNILKERYENQRSEFAKLTDDEIREIRSLYNENPKIYTQRVLGRKYSIPRCCIGRILNGISYRWVKNIENV